MATETNKTSSLRSQKKQKTRAAILNEARRMFSECGFDDTTIDEICEVTSVSRRTFFRYFPSKEALVFPNRQTRLDTFAEFLKSRPTNDDLYNLLRTGTAMFSANYKDKREQLLEMQALIARSTVLQACEHDIDREWEDMIGTALVFDFGDTEEGNYQARMLAGAMIGIIRATMRFWYQGGGKEDLTELGLRALDALQRGFPLPSDT